MKLLIKFPTRGRRSKFFNVLKKYELFLSKEVEYQFLITMDEDDKEMNNTEVIEILKTFNNLSFFYGNSKSKVEAVNNDIDKVKDWDILLLASDDMIPVEKNYDKIIIDEMKKEFSDTDGVLFFHDGFVKNKVNTLSILGKKYFDRFNYIYYPEYLSTYCDNEFTEVADILHKQKYINKIIIRHEHPDHGFGSRDFVHYNNMLNEKHDSSLFLKRKKDNFNL